MRVRNDELKLNSTWLLTLDFKNISELFSHNSNIETKLPLIGGGRIVILISRFSLIFKACI